MMLLIVDLHALEKLPEPGAKVPISTAGTISPVAGLRPCRGEVGVAW